MKTFFLNLFFCFFSIGLSAQVDVEHIFSGKRNYSISSHLQTANEVHAVGSRNLCLLPVLSELTSGNTQIWDGASGHWNYDELVYLDSSSEAEIVVCGYYQEGDDFISPLDVLKVIGYKKNGAIVFETELPGGSASEMKMAVTGNDNIMVTAGNVVHTLSPSGEYLGNVEESDFKFIALERYPAATGAMLVALSAEALTWLNWNGHVVQTMNLDAEGIDLWVKDELIYVLTQDGLLEVMDLDSYNDYPGIGIGPNASKGITGNDDDLFIWGKEEGADFPMIMQLNGLDLSIIDFWILEQTGTSISKVTATNETLVMSGNYDLPLNYRTSFVKSFDLGSPISFKGGDVRLTSITTNSEWTYTSEVLDPVEPLILYYFKVNPFVFTLEVTNAGSEVLTSFTLVGQRLGGFNCFEAREFYHYKDLSIPPGESMTFVETSNIVLSPTVNATPPPLVFSVFAPNHHFDENPADNSLELDIFVPVNEMEFIDRIVLAPNPANDVLRLNLEAAGHSGSLQTTVYNAIGQKLNVGEKAVFQNTYNTTFDTSDFPNGIYFLKIEIDGGSLTRKFVVRH